MSLDERFLKSCWENVLEDVKDCLEEGVYVNTVGAVESVRVPSEGGATWSGLTIAAVKDYRDLLDLLLSQPGIAQLATMSRGRFQARSHLEYIFWYLTHRFAPLSNFV